MVCGDDEGGGIPIHFTFQTITPTTSVTSRRFGSLRVGGGATVRVSAGGRWFVLELTDDHCQSGELCWEDGK